MESCERFLFDRQTKSIAAGQETLLYERKLVRQAWTVVHQAILDWDARGFPIVKSDLKSIFGEKMMEQIGVINSAFSIR